VEGLYGASLDLSYEAIATLLPEQQLSYFQERLKMADLLAPDIGIEQIRGLILVYKNQVQMTYQPKETYPHQITFFMSSKDESEEELESLETTASGWDKLCSKPLDVHIIPGNHFTMLNEPHVRVLAERLAACINNVEKLIEPQLEKQTENSA
jgi:thioesterase domain-containing protein